MKSSSTRMNIPLVSAATSLILLAACTPPPAPPPHFKPIPPNPPEQVSPYDDDSTTGQPADSNPSNINEQPAPTRPGEYPTARPTANPDEVISPYEPYDLINVEGFHSGQLARDPRNKKIFRVP